jgi:hypothetical protein
MLPDLRSNLACLVDVLSPRSGLLALQHPPFAERHGLAIPYHDLIEDSHLNECQRLPQSVRQCPVPRLGSAQRGGRRIAERFVRQFEEQERSQDFDGLGRR